MTDTPRTDAEASDGWSGDAECVSADFARELERENGKLRKALVNLVGADGKEELEAMMAVTMAVTRIMEIPDSERAKNIVGAIHTLIDTAP